MRHLSVPASWIHRGGHSPERFRVRQSHPDDREKGAKAWGTDPDGQFRLEAGNVSPTPKVVCRNRGGWQILSHAPAERGCRSLPSSIPLWILLPLPVTPTQPAPGGRTAGQPAPSGSPLRAFPNAAEEVHDELRKIFPAACTTIKLTLPPFKSKKLLVLFPPR